MNYHYLPAFKGNTSNEHVAEDVWVVLGRRWKVELFVCIFPLIVRIIFQPIPSSNVWEKITVRIQ